MRSAVARVIYLRLWRGFALAVVVAAAAYAEEVPPAAPYHNKLGITAYDAGRFGEAIKHFEQAYQAAPENATVRGNLCNAYQARANELAQAADYPSAVRFLENAIGIDTGNVGPLVQLGAYYLRLDMVPEAIFRLEEAIELEPGHLDSHELLGEAYYRDNDLSSARGQWEYVLAKDPSRTSLRERYEKAFREESVEGDFNQASSTHFKFSYTRSMPATLKNQLVQALERAYSEIGREFGGQFPPGPIPVIIYDYAQFEEATQVRDHVGALYDGKIRLPITSKEGEYLAIDDIARRIRHEYVHVVVRFVAGTNVPWWLNEGLAETFSSDIGPIDRQVLNRAYANGTTFKLSDLSPNRLQSLEPDPLRLAYIQSHATVEMMINRFGQRSMLRLLQALSQGTDGEEAVRATYRRDYRTLEGEVAASFS